jgi:hypothetical protein
MPRGSYYRGQVPQGSSIFFTGGDSHGANVIPNAYMVGSSVTSNAGTGPINFPVLKDKDNFNFFPQANDLLLAIMTIDDDGAVITATGWNVVGSISDGAKFVKLAVYWKLATGSEAKTGNPWSISYTAAGSAHAATMLCFRGEGGIILQIGNNSFKLNATSTNMATDSFTSVANSKVLVATALGGTGATATTNRITPPSGFTEATEKDEALAWVSAHLKQDDTGSTATYTATSLLSSSNMTWVGEIRAPTDVTPPTLEAYFFGGG